MLDSSKYIYINIFTYIVSDLSSGRGDYIFFSKDGFWGHGLWRRWPVCLQLCLLSLIAFCGAERDFITLCTCSLLLNHRWGDPNAICCFLIGSTCDSKLNVHRMQYHILIEGKFIVKLLIQCNAISFYLVQITWFLNSVYALHADCCLVGNCSVD